jgi:hypothetical protein
MLIHFIKQIQFMVIQVFHLHGMLLVSPSLSSKLSQLILYDSAQMSFNSSLFFDNTAYPLRTRHHFQHWDKAMMKQIGKKNLPLTEWGKGKEDSTEMASYPVSWKL